MVDVNKCVNRIEVNPVYGATHSPGFACGWTGGHCVPGEKCDSYCKSFYEAEKINNLFEGYTETPLHCFK